MFRLGRSEFEVTAAEIHGFFTEKQGLLWFLSVDTEGELIFYDCENEKDHLWPLEPWLYHCNGIHLDISSWKELEGLDLQWDSEYDVKGDEAGVLYVLEHEDVTKCRIEFLERHGAVFSVRWTGTAHVYVDDEYGENVPFAFQGDMTFEGISVQSALPEQEVTEVLKRVTDLDGLVCTGSGGEWQFVPVK